MPELKSLGRIPVGVFVGCVSAPIVVAFAIICHFAVNLPVVDDYNAVLVFALGYQHLSTVHDRLLYLIDSQHGDYKLVFEHLVVAGGLLFDHRVNFVFLQLAGSLFLLGILYLLWKSYFSDTADLRTRLLLFLPISLLFCSLNYAETLDFASASLDFIPAIFFSLGAIYLLTRQNADSRHFDLAALAALLGYFSSPNSFLVYPIALYLLVPRRAWAAISVWTATLIVGLAPYFYRYAPVARNPRGLWIKIPLFFLSFLGAGLTSHVLLAIPIGTVVLLTYVWSIRTSFHRQFPAAFFGVTWVLASAAMASAGRSDSGVRSSMAPRYQMLSDLVLAYCYGFLVERVQRSGVAQSGKKRLYQVALAATLLFCLHADGYCWKFLRDRRQDLSIGLSHYRTNPAVNSPMWFEEDAVNVQMALAEEEARTVLRQATQEGTYSPPAD